jgi:LysR family transcriptional regulator, nitrogen assimilation regulatory protein
MKLVDHLDKLRAFQAIAEAGKLSEAAKRLHMSQPSLTRLIHTLEDASGATLLHRSRQGVVPTRAGHLLLEYSKSILARLEDVEQQLKAPELENIGLLRIGSYESLAEYLWPDFIASFKKTAPSLKLLIRTNSSFAHQKALESGELDVLVDAEPRILGNFTSWALYHDRFRFYRVGGPLSLDPKSIGDLPIVFCPSAYDEDNRTILAHLEEKGYDFRERMELDSFTSVRTFARAGLGLAVLPRRLAESSPATQRLSAVTLKGFSSNGFGRHGIFASVRSDRAEDHRISLLIRSLREKLGTR